MGRSTNAALEHWQQKGFSDTDIPLRLAVASLESSKPLVQAKPMKHGSWGFFDVSTGEEAVLSHAGVWAWGSDIQTGNYVPNGEEAPLGLPDSQIQNKVNWKCDIAYTFDTLGDKSLNKLLEALETHVQAVPGFNRGKRPRRRPWQPNEDRFTFSSKLFISIQKAKPAEERIRGITYSIHPWIRKALDLFGNERLVPNPDLPNLFDFTDQKLKDLADSEHPLFFAKDLIWTSFKVVFKIGPKDWGRTIVPVDFVRVGRVLEEEDDDPAEEPTPSQGSSIVQPSSLRKLQTGSVPIIDGAARVSSGLPTVSGNASGLCTGPSIQAVRPTDAPVSAASPILLAEDSNSSPLSSPSDSSSICAKRPREVSEDAAGPEGEPAQVPEADKMDVRVEQPKKKHRRR